MGRFAGGGCDPGYWDVPEGFTRPVAVARRSRDLLRKFAAIDSRRRADRRAGARGPVSPVMHLTIGRGSGACWADRAEGATGV